jgi:Na+/proline symporter
MNFSLLAFIGLFFAWMLFIGYRTWRGHNKTELRENFLIGNRNVSAWLVAIGTTMGWVDALCFGVVPGLGHQYGWGSLWYLAGASLPFGLLAVFAGRIRNNAARTGAYMMGNYFSKIFSPRCAATVGLMVSLYFTLWLLSQLTIGGQMLAAVTGMPYGLIIGSMGLVTLAYMLMGGFLAGVKTDLAQFGIFIVFMLVLGGMWAAHGLGWLPPFGTTIWQGYADPFTMFMMSFVATVAAPDVWQRIYSADSAHDARKSMLLLIPLIIVIYSCFLSFGFIIKSLGLPLDANGMTTAVLTVLTPSWLLPLTLLAFMAATMSTIATTLFGSAMAVTSDIALEMKWIKPAHATTLCRVLMVAVLLAMLGMALLQLNMLSLYLTIMAICAVVVPLMACALLNWKVSEPAAFYSLAVSLAAFFIGVYANIYTGPLALLPLLTATGTLLLFEGLARKH